MLQPDFSLAYTPTSANMTGLSPTEAIGAIRVANAEGNNWIKLNQEDVEKISELRVAHNNLAIKDLETRALGTSRHAEGTVCFDFSTGIAMCPNYGNAFRFQWKTAAVLQRQLEGDDGNYEDDPNAGWEPASTDPTRPKEITRWRQTLDVRSRVDIVRGTRDIASGSPGANPKCRKCGTDFGFFSNWRNNCSVCRWDFCIECIANKDKAGCCGGDQAVCEPCFRMRSTKEDRQCVDASKQAKEFLLMPNLEFDKAELLYLLPYVVGGAKYAMHRGPKDYAKLLSDINVVWKSDVEELQNSNEWQSSFDKSAPFQKMAVHCAQEGWQCTPEAEAQQQAGDAAKDNNSNNIKPAVPLKSGEAVEFGATGFCPSKTNADEACAWLFANRAKLDDPYRFNRTRLLIALKDFSASEVADEKAWKARWPLIKFLEALPQASQDKIVPVRYNMRGIREGIDQLKAKIAELAETLETMDFVKHPQPVGSWQRALARNFQHADDAVTCISAVFLYTLDSLAFYQVINGALYDGNKNALHVLKPLIQALEEFIDKMPKKAVVCYRGQSHRVTEHLDEMAPPFPLTQFTSATTDFAIAYQAFIRANKSGTFLAYIAFRCVEISTFSATPDDCEVLFPPGTMFETVHRVPLKDLSIMDQRFDIGCLQQVATEVPPPVRLRLCLEALHFISVSFKEIQKFFMAPRLSEDVSSDDKANVETSVSLMEAVEELLQPGNKFPWLNLRAVAGMGKSTLSVYVNSVVNQQKLNGYHSLLVSLPAVGTTLFEEDALEKHIMYRLRIGEEEMELLAKEKFLVVLDSLDEVALSHWPTDEAIGESLNPRRWPHLRMIQTCRGEHLEKYGLSMRRLSNNLGKTLGMVTFGAAEVSKLLNIWVPGETPEEEECRKAALDEYNDKSDAFRTPFMLYLLANSHRARLLTSRASSAQQFSATFNPEQELGATILGRFGPIKSSKKHKSDAKLNIDSDAAEALQEDFQNASPGALTTEASIGGMWTMPSNTLVEQLAEMSMEQIITATTEGICEVYEIGIKSLIASNIRRIWRNMSGADLKYLIEDVFEWSQFLALIMLADNEWRGSLDEFREILEDEPQCWFSRDATVMVLLAPLRISGYSALPNFEFRHKSVQEFLVAYAITHCSSTRFLELITRIDINIHPNVQFYLRLLPQRARLGAGENFDEPPGAGDGLPRLYRVSDVATFLKKAAEPCAKLLTRLCLNEIVEDEESLLATFSVPDTLPILTHLEIGCSKKIVKAILDQQCLGAIDASSKRPPPRLETLFLSHPTVDDNTVTTAIETCPLNCISFAGTGITNKAIKRLVQHGKADIRTLDLGRCPNLTDEMLVTIEPSRIRNLWFLSLSGNPNIGDKFIYHIAANCDELRHLDISDTKWIRDPSIRAIAEGCRELRDFNISGNHEITHDPLERLLGNSLSLIKFSAAGFRYNLNTALQRIASTQMMILNLSGAANVSEMGVSVAKRCPQLRILDVSHTRISDNVIATVAMSCPQLRVLDVGRVNGAVSDESIISIADHCPQLRELDVSKLYGWVSDRSIIQVAEKCPRLRALRCEHTNKVTNAGILKIAEHCRELRELNVSFSSSLTDKTLYAVAKPPSSDATTVWLRKLNVSFIDSRHITSAGLRAIADACPWLEELRLAGTGGDQITEPFVDEICQKCRRLRELDISGPHAQLTDDCVKAITKNLHMLRYLNIAYSDSAISPSVLTPLLEHCPLMRELDVRHTEMRKYNISKDDVKALKKNFPLLKVDYGEYNPNLLWK